MAGKGHSAVRMAEVRSQRGPFSDVRDGRLHHQIRIAFWAMEGLGPSQWKPKGTPEEATTDYLMSYCYPREHVKGQLRSWHRTNTIKAARKVAVPKRKTGKGAGSGCGFVWTPVTELLEDRCWIGKADRRRARDDARRNKSSNDAPPDTPNKKY